MDGLINDVTFMPLNECELNSNTSEFGSRFVDELKHVGDRLREKSRLIAPNYGGRGCHLQ